MSQTNEFQKAILPDYVYFDLQSTNTYNNEIGITPQLQFLENRDAPIVENAGEYNMSVTRFSVDTANLPVLVVEPDIKGSDPFDPHKTIHRVAIITESANLKANATGAVTTQQTFSLSSSTTRNLLGYSVATSADGEVIVFGEPYATSEPLYVPAGEPFDPYEPDSARPTPQYIYAKKHGKVHIGIRNALGTYSTSVITNSIPFINTITSTVGGTYEIDTNTYIGLNVAISGDGNIVFIGTGSSSTYYYTYNRITGSMTTHTKTYTSRVVIASNYTGTYFIVGYPTHQVSSVSVGAIEIRSLNLTTQQQTLLYTAVGSGTTNMGYAVDINYVGDIACSTKTITSGAGNINVYYTSNNWTATGVYSLVTNVAGNFGASVNFNRAGTSLAVGATTSSTTGQVFVYPFSKSSGIGTAVTISPNGISGVAVGFGSAVALSYDGLTLHIGAPNNATNTGVVQSFQYSSSTWSYKSQTTGTAQQAYYGSSVGSSADIAYVVGSPSVDSSSGIQGRVATNKLVVATNETLPSNLTNTASVVNVNWISDNTTSTPPAFSQLTGTNTSTFPYYHCHSYNNFIDVVNVAIKEAYISNFNKLWTDWISSLSVANASFIKAEFINIVARCFATPPYMEWNSTLDATMYLNTLFSAIGNYYIPSRTFTINDQTQVSSTEALLPFQLRVAFNASLYSLFSSFPATETIIDGEKFYMLNVPRQVALLRDNSTIPLRAMSLIPEYPFLYEYYDNASNVLTIPYPTGSLASYPKQDYFILLKQEISTIDAWCPISSIVFTSNQLPIIVSQFSSSNTTGITPNSALIGNRFALVITDLMTNQQGYRPNIIYNPTAEYRRISLTGNMGIRNIDINVFWRSKTGQLLPFRLPSGGSATLKLLFEKKNRNPEKIIEPPVAEDIMGGRMRSRR